MPESRLTIGIIGAGWAGLSAAVRLHGLGHSVSVFEASHILGGRARTVFSRRLQQPIDNGQHILIGAYEESIRLINTLSALPVHPAVHTPEQSGHHRGGDDNKPVVTALARQSLSIRSASGKHAIETARLPAPLHLLAGLLTAKGFSWRERAQITRSLLRLKTHRWQTPSGLSVADWLKAEKQTANTVRHLWEPICLAALNTPAEDACAQIFATVLRDSLGGNRRDADILIPAVRLGSLWPEHLPADINIYTGSPVRAISLSPNGQASIAGKPFDAVIVATSTRSARRLLASLSGNGSHIASTPAPENTALGKSSRLSFADRPTDADKHMRGKVQVLLECLDRFRFIPIATLVLELESPWILPHPMLMLEDSTDSKAFGQWLFGPTAKAAPAPTEKPLLQVVISDATRLQGHSMDTIAEGVIEQVRQQVATQAPMPAVRNYDLITEKRATFACTPGLQRPGNKTPWPAIWLAGDWTDTGYPAVLEGAVRSGRRAADELLAASGLATSW